MSAHGRAFETLVRRRREYVPDCVRCHVVGMGEPTGYDTIWETHDSDGLSGVGCESCHGGGADHVRAPTRRNTGRHMSEVQCKVCHDAKHSPDFDFATCLHKIKHW